MTTTWDDSKGLLLPDGRLSPPHLITDKDGVSRLPGTMTRSEWNRWQAFIRSQYFLFRNEGGDYGERPICKTKMPDGTYRGCGQKHMYFTSMCVEMPFRGGQGLEQGLMLSFRAATDGARKNSILTALSKLPDIAEGHPFSARDFAPKEPGENWLAVLLSLPEPITKAKAIHFGQQINSRHPLNSFCLLENCHDFMYANKECMRGEHAWINAPVIALA